MRRALWMLAVPVLAVWGPEVAQAQFQTFDDCSFVCTSERSCDTSCLYDDPFTEEEETWLTCGHYGVCDPDPDNDGLTYDNCPHKYNPDQGDCDGDGIGNVCDSQNATWQPAEPLHTCHIYDRRHVGYVDVTKVSEQVLIDVSNCYGTQWGGTGIAWTRSEVRAKCYGTWPDAWNCCVSWFGFTDCADYFGRNSCGSG